MPQVSIYIPTSLLDRCRVAAQGEGRSVSGYIGAVLERTTPLVTRAASVVKLQQMAQPEPNPWPPRVDPRKPQWTNGTLEVPPASEMSAAKQNELERLWREWRKEHPDGRMADRWPWVAARLAQFVEPDEA